MIRHLKTEVNPISASIITTKNGIQPLIQPLGSADHTYFTYRGDSEQEAQTFLEKLDILQTINFHYFAVEVGDIAYCRDKIGYYQQKAVFQQLPEPKTGTK